MIVDSTIVSYGYGTISMALAQDDGRVWAGDIYLKKDNITIEKK